MKSLYVLLICFFMFIVTTINLNAQDLSNDFLINLDGVDINYIKTQDLVYFDDVTVEVYEDNYMGAAFITEYDSDYLGYIISMFGTYSLSFSETGEITGAHRMGTSSCTNDFTTNDLIIMEEKSLYNKNWLANNQFGSGDTLETVYIYNQQFLDNGGYTYNDLKRYFAISTAIMQVTFDLNGINYWVDADIAESTNQNYTSVYDYLNALQNQDPSISDDLDIMKNYDFTIFEVAYNDSILNNSYLVGNSDAVDSLTSYVFNLGSNPYDMPQGIVHEFFHTTLLDHSQYSGSEVSNSVYQRQSGGYNMEYMEGYGYSNSCSVGSIMSYSTNRTLVLSNPNLLFIEPDTENVKFGDYIYSNSYNFIKNSENNYSNQIEETANYSETYETYPQLKVSNDTGSFHNYEIIDESNSGYSDLEFYDDSSIEVVEEESTYKVGGSGRKYDKLVLKATNSYGNEKYYTRYIENNPETYDNDYLPITYNMDYMEYTNNPEFQITITANENNESDVLVDAYVFRNSFTPGSGNYRRLLYHDTVFGTRENGYEFNAKDPFYMNPGEVVTINYSFERMLANSFGDDLIMFEIEPQVLYEGHSNYNIVAEKVYFIK